MPPDEFLARLGALVPPPGFHPTRYYGVFANRHHLRARIIPPTVVTIAVGTALRSEGSGRPPHRSERALLTHSAPTSGSIVEAFPGKGM